MSAPTNHTIDLIVQGAYKAKIITKYQRTLFGRTLTAHVRGDYSSMQLAADVYPKFTAFERKFKRAALAGALRCYFDKAEQAHGVDFNAMPETDEVNRLLLILANKTASHMNVLPLIESDWDDEDEVETSTVVQTAWQVLRDMDTDAWYDISAAQRDPESEDYAASVMVRPLAIIQAEQAERAEEIRLQRMAEAARIAAADSDDADEDDDDWDIEDDDDSM